MADRTEDMGTVKRLKISRDNEGDVLVAIVTGRGLPGVIEHGGRTTFASVEFCMSGCNSPRTRAALMAVMEAMAEDERDRPDPHRPANAIPQ